MVSKFSVVFDRDLPTEKLFELMGMSYVHVIVQQIIMSLSSHQLVLKPTQINEKEISKL